VVIARGQWAEKAVRETVRFVVEAAMREDDLVALLERSGPRAELDAAVEALDHGRGRLVLVHGEAGIGKTSLVGEFLAGLAPGRRLLSGGCDDLLAPRPLGAVLELVDGMVDRPDLTTHPGRQLYEALRSEPTICVVDDVHWADEATLDVLTYLARRVPELPLLLLLTFRDDEMPADHPLHRTLAAAPPSHCRRIGLAPLSLDAVRHLAAPGVDAEAVHRVTGGNPFFVSEALTSGAQRVPASVRDAVLGRFGRLPPSARTTAELVSVVPGRAEPWLVEACLGGKGDVGTCERHGLLTVDRDGIRFRHELARWVIEEALPGPRRSEHNRAVLRALIAAEAPDARLAHHAWRAGDAAAVVRHGLSAARQAAASRSHREAADLFGQVLEHEELLAPRERADAFDDFSTEAYSAGRDELAVHARERALALRRQLGDPRRTGDTLRWLSRVRWTSGDRAGAEVAAQEAVAILVARLKRAPPCRELAMALSNNSQLAMLAHRDEEAIRLGEQAAEIAEALGDTETVVHAQVNIGTAVAHRDLDAGLELLAEAARTAARLGHDDTACRALVNATWRCMTAHRIPAATRLVEQAMALAHDRELPIYIDYLHVTRALLALATGDFTAARSDVDKAPNANRAPSLLVQASIATRRGEPDAAALLHKGWEVALATAELQRLVPMACLRAEWAWLRGDAAGMDAVTRDTYELALRHGSPWDIGDLAIWRWRGGVLDGAPEGLPEPYALEVAGTPRLAAEAWERLGEPYPQALALLGSRSPDDVTEAIEILDRLGAAAVLPLARSRLRDLGAATPRGRASSTRRNPGGLTDRQLEVARLLGRGLSNPEIAHELVLSPKTVEHHVGAVLTKLGAASRIEAADAARRLGISDSALSEGRRRGIGGAVPMSAGLGGS
jgi:DNA-binding CsgD family transcriptional regulator/tetratricopeptide (TPR) repeat protein